MKAFTNHPVWNLNTFEGKKVCFNSLVFSLLPRMVDGLYYNTKLSGSCQNSSLFNEFGVFIKNSILSNVIQDHSLKKIRVTILNRETKFRQVVNLEALISGLNKAKYEVTVANFSSYGPPFEDQVRIVSQTDILVGMHGAGLTHMLFLPKWSAVFELYNCEDPKCYSDLARLNGIKYQTLDKKWVKFESGDRKRPKFANFSIDKSEFIRKMNQLTDLIRMDKTSNINSSL